MIQAIVLIALSMAAPAASVQASTPYDEFVPKVADEELSEVIGKVQWYTHREMPPVFQHDFGNPFVSIYRDIGPGGPRFSNGNGEWPWAHPAVFRDDGGRTKAIVGAYIPGRPDVFSVSMKTYTISTYPQEPGRYEVRHSGFRRGINWKFPVGTEFVELNLNRIGDGDYCYKIHRMSMGEDGAWKFSVYRPWTSQEDYEKDTGTRVVDIGVKRLRSQHMNAAFDRAVEMQEAPPISPELSIELLESTPFKLCSDDSFIPTTNHENQVWPKGYLGKFIGNAASQDNCRSCHQQVLEEVRKFDNGEWYGHIRGGGHDIHGAGVFSWYPR